MKLVLHKDELAQAVQMWLKDSDNGVHLDYDVKLEDISFEIRDITNESPDIIAVWEIEIGKPYKQFDKP